MAAMLTARALGRATLARQLLLRREAVDVADGVRRVAAIQAQAPASPYIALWNRVADLTPAAVDDAFASFAVVKATLMRVTLHAVHADDHALFHRAMQPTLRAARLNDRRFTGQGLTARDADALVERLPELLATPQSNADMEEKLAHPRLWWALRHYGPVVHAPVGSTWTFGERPAYLAAPHQSSSVDPDEAAKHLVRRYLAAFGPATAADVAQFALMPRARAREVVGSMREELVTREGPDGALLLDVDGAPLPDEDVPAPPRLLPMWDSVLLAYADRSRTVPPEYRPLVTCRNGDVLPTVLVDGKVAGVWRPVPDGGLEVSAFHRLTDDDWEGVAREAAGLVAFLGEREPLVYSRYGHWWRDLPAAEVRTLGT